MCYYGFTSLILENECHLTSWLLVVGKIRFSDFSLFTLEYCRHEKKLKISTQKSKESVCIEEREIK